MTQNQPTDGLSHLSELFGGGGAYQSVPPAPEDHARSKRRRRTRRIVGLVAAGLVVAVVDATLVLAGEPTVEATADPELLKLYHELKAYPIPARSAPLSSDNVAIPFKMRLDGDILSFFSTTMIFGTPVDITLSELALETFFPADDLTAERMRNMAASLK